MMDRSKARQIALWLIAADFPLLYVAAVSLENPTLTALALLIMASAAVVAAMVF